MKKVACLFLFLCFCIGSGAVKPDRTYRFYPEKLGLIYKDLKVTASDGIDIKTWYYPAQAPLSEKEANAVWENPVKRDYAVLDDTKRPTVVICNGDAFNMTWQQYAHVMALTAAGYNVATFDWRGFGESGEWEMDTDLMACTEFLLDYDAVIDEVVLQQETDAGRMAVMGWSTGAYLSMAAASKRPEVKCLVAQALMTSFDDVMPLVNALRKNAGRNIIAPPDYPESLNPLNLAPGFDKAVLLIVGELDDRTPVWMSRKIYDALPAAKELWIVENAEHGGPEGPVRDWDEYHRKIISFLKENL